MIALLMDSGTIEIFEKTFIGDFSCVNNPIAFDTNIVMSNVKLDLANGLQEKKGKI